jgi:hypothetical protein
MIACYASLSGLGKIPSVALREKHDAGMTRDEKAALYGLLAVLKMSIAADKEEIE